MRRLVMGCSRAIRATRAVRRWLVPVAGAVIVISTVSQTRALSYQQSTVKAA